MTSTSLVTGGAGFMGSHVSGSLLKAGHDVVVLDDLSGGFIENVPDGAEFVEGSADFRPIETAHNAGYGCQEREYELAIQVKRSTREGLT